VNDEEGLRRVTVTLDIAADRVGDVIAANAFLHLLEQLRNDGVEIASASLEIIGTLSSF
jgi:hypothetical protein